MKIRIWMPLFHTRSATLAIIPVRISTRPFGRPLSSRNWVRMVTSKILEAPAAGSATMELMSALMISATTPAVTMMEEKR